MLSSTRRMVLLSLVALGAGGASLAAAAGEARAGNTSCDVITGASCSYGEGCDCDHDGYVRSNGKASRYCHFNKCPIDGNDNNASVLGVPSQYNADGDGWTTAYDCDDHDACVTNTCANICGPPPVDADSDGFAAGVDCDDNNFYIKPGASIACCSCEVLTSPSQVAAYGCAAHPCPNGTTPVDTTPEDTFVPTDATAPEDATPPPDALVGGDAAIVGQYTTPPVGPELVGSGSMEHGAPPPPGCAGGGGAEGVGLALLAFGLLALVARRRRRAVAAALAVTLVAGALIGGCVTVQPWERGRLAKAPMVFGADPQSEALEQHMFQYREGSAGGFGGGGGGCGCN